MADFISTEETPAFAATIVSILERYKSSTIERQNAVRALTAVTLALAPEELFSEADEDRLNELFGAHVDFYRAGNAIARDQVIAFIAAAARGQRGLLKPRY